MIARISRLASALLVTPLLVGVAGLVPSVRPAPPAPAYAPPPRESSPFSSPDVFCKPSENKFADVPPSDPRLRDNPVTVVMLTPGPTAPSTSIDPEALTGDAAGAAETFATLINRCGGIAGRPFDLRVVTESADPAADCLTATQRYHPLVVVSWTASPAQRCIARDQRTIMVTASDVSNDDLTGTSGRLVATGSSEGVERARLLDLVASGRLKGRAVAIVAGTSPSDRQFQTTAQLVLAESGIPIVDPSHANTVLEPSLDPTTVRSLELETAAVRRRRPLELYGFSQATIGVLDQLRAIGSGDPAGMPRSSNLLSFVPFADTQYRAAQSPNTFSGMCNSEYATAWAKRTSSTATTPPSDAPLSETYLRITDVCLAMRIVARGLYAAGVDLNQQSLIRALHRLPYIDLAAPGGTPKPRPNQIVNEPVTRIAQVVVLMEAQSACSNPPTPSTPVAGPTCWEPVSGWDEGGRVVNAPLKH